MNNFKIDVFPQKTFREYILLSTFEQKTAFSAIYKPKRAQNRPFFRRFRIFWAALRATHWLTRASTQVAASALQMGLASSHLHDRSVWRK
jgi:hypothetical protein